MDQAQPDASVHQAAHDFQVVALEQGMPGCSAGIGRPVAVNDNGIRIFECAVVIRRFSVPDYLGPARLYKPRR